MNRANLILSLVTLVVKFSKYESEKLALYCEICIYSIGNGHEVELFKKIIDHLYIFHGSFVHDICHFFYQNVEVGFWKPALVSVSSSLSQG